MDGGSNTYLYVNANPIRFIDSFGLDALCGPGYKAVPDPKNPGGQVFNCVRDPSEDPNSKICVTGNCADDLPQYEPLAPGEPLSCQTKCNLLVGTICGPLATATTETGPGSVAAFIACRAGVYADCLVACFEPKDDECKKE